MKHTWQEHFFLHIQANQSSEIPTLLHWSTNTSQPRWNATSSMKRSLTSPVGKQPFPQLLHQCHLSSSTFICPIQPTPSPAFKLLQPLQSVEKSAFIPAPGRCPGDMAREHRKVEAYGCRGTNTENLPLLSPQHVLPSHQSTSWARSDQEGHKPQCLNLVGKEWSKT